MGEARTFGTSASMRAPCCPDRPTSPRAGMRLRSFSRALILPAKMVSRTGCVNSDVFWNRGRANFDWRSRNCRRRHSSIAFRRASRICRARHRVSGQPGARRLALRQSNTGDPAQRLLRRRHQRGVDRPPVAAALAAGDRAQFKLRLRSRRGRSEAYRRQLGARYLLEGRLRRADSGFSIVTSLIDSESGFSLWSRRLLLPATTSQQAPGPSGRRILSASLTSESTTPSSCVPLEIVMIGADVRDPIWRGRWHLNRLAPSRCRARAQPVRQGARTRTSFLESPEALIQARDLLPGLVNLGDAAFRTRRLRKCGKLAQRAILADCDDGRGHMLAGIAEIWLRNPQACAGVAAYGHRAQSEPWPSPTAQLGSSLMLAGQPLSGDRAAEDRPEAHSPNDVHIFYPLSELAMSYAMLGQWAEAIEHADQALLRRPALLARPCRQDANALARSGDLPGASAALAALLAAAPGFSREYVEWLPFVDRAWIDFLTEGVAMTPNSTVERPGARSSVILS